MRRLLLLVVLAAALLSGCGGVESSLLATAVRSTQAAGGADVAMQMTVNAAGQTVSMTGSGVVDAAGKRSQMSFDVSGAGHIDAVTDGFVVYMRSDQLGAMLGGKQWMKLDMERSSKTLGLDLNSMSQLGQNPSEQLELLEKVSDGVSELGRETVVGVQATHYRATLDLRKYPGQNLDKLIELTGQSEIPIDVWIDDANRVRRMEWKQEMNRGPLQMSFDAVVEYRRFGVQANVDIPSDDEVFDATDLAVQGMQQQLP
jgi:uncharacterized protein YceK